VTKTTTSLFARYQNPSMDDSPTNPEPKRRWWQFSLRTVLFAAVLLACWLDYEMNWHWQRRALIKRERAAL
jgi:hypothetical protein